MAGLFSWLFGPAGPPVDPDETDPPLLQDHSEIKTYKTSRFEYPDLRIFFRQHVKAAELPKCPAPLPLLVCIPGLGGSVAQFHPLLRSLVDLAPCLVIDFPGCGRSKFSQTNWDAYSQDSLAELLETIIEDHRDKESGQSVVLIGHSMGTAMSARLASKKAPHTTSLVDHIAGVIGICPVAGPFDEVITGRLRKLIWVPGWLFGLWRAVDGFGGPNSASVSRFVGEDAAPELRILQHRYNQQSRTPVWRRTAFGATPLYQDGVPEGGLLLPEDGWGQLDVPVYLIAGAADKVTPPSEVDKIIAAIKANQGADAGEAPTGDSIQAHSQPPASEQASAPVTTSFNPQDHIPRHIEDISESDFDKVQSEAQSSSLDVPQEDAQDDDNEPSTPADSPPAPLPPQPKHPAMTIQSIIFPAPANHTLPYNPRTSRALAGLISDFLANRVTGRLSLAWQLQHLSREGKWDVKNLQKWRSVVPVSEPIGPAGRPIFRAMKTLREADDTHSPAEFAARWSTAIRDVIDISKDQPVYDPRGLERGGIHYHKFPNMSKLPPSAERVDAFIELVDSIREVQARRAEEENWEGDDRQPVIGVHCHYGYNRTGYFLVCYLVERCGFSLQDAIEAFGKARPNGIRHSYFLDRLYMRYNLERAAAV
ncbi:hypothetical protein K4F52_000072 [Lecanicillium sp. MT-2017a]|nr:hypothetical protein K4F52_000072 [Lecanicillium sp. MT-2017a]